MLRLTGGEFRGRSIHTPRHDRTRPTQAKLRQALFNSLQVHIPEARVLDLFAGSGALGFEALSRGAQHVTFVESDRATVKLIEKSATELKVLDRVKIVAGDVTGIWPRIQERAPFDLIFADPPYSEGWEEKLLRDLPWGECLSESGFFCLEWGTQKSQVRELPEQVPFLAKVREKNYGDSMLTTFQKAEQ